jgi:hypothetical protein
MTCASSILGLWTRLAALREVIEAAGAAEGTTCVAIEVVSDEEITRDPAWSAPLGGLPDCVPADVAWMRLGFDVADQGYTSALSNCGWSKDERRGAVARWSPLLNEHGLLATAGAADAFRSDADDRAPEHAPFFVYRLSVLPWSDIA